MNPITLIDKKKRLNQKCSFQLNPEITEPQPHGNFSQVPRSANATYEVKTNIKTLERANPHLRYFLNMSKATVANSNTGSEYMAILAKFLLKGWFRIPVLKLLKFTVLSKATGIHKSSNRTSMG